MAEARQFPGQEKEVFEFYRRNPGAAAQKRAPIYEEKVCDYIFGVAKVTDEKVSKEELAADEDLPESAPAPKTAKKAAAKKAKADEGPAEKAASDEPSAEKAAAKKPAAKKAKAAKSE
jgi:trigger factor